MMLRASILLPLLAPLATALQDGHSPSPSRDIGSVVQGATFETVWQVGTPIDGIAAAWQAPNRLRGLRSFFTASGVQVFPWSGIGGWSWGTKLVSVARGELASAALPLSPHAEGRRVEYRRGELLEWYVNDGRGLEQGFTFPARPPGAADEPLRLTLEVTGNLRAELDADRSGARFSNERGEVVLHYAGLVTRDAQGAELPCWLSQIPGGLAIEVDDREAVYPIEVDPLIFTEGQILYPSYPEFNQHFGSALAVDGDTLAVGAESYPSAAVNHGAVYVFVRENGRWLEQALLTAADADVGDFMGRTVDISGDVIVAGADGDDDLGNYSGAAYVFRRHGTLWVREAKLRASDGTPGDFFGVSVAVDGSTILVGAYADDDLGLTSGSVYVFEHDGQRWAETSKLLASDGEAWDRFGYEVCLAGDTAFVGVPTDDDLVEDEGSVYVFERAGQDWYQSAKLKASGAGSPEAFGYRIDSTSNRMVAGAWSAQGVAPNAGAVYVFDRINGFWTETARLVASDGAYNDKFGYDVAVSGDLLLAGSLADVGSDFSAGTAYVFRRIGSQWTEVARLQAEDPHQNAFLSWSVALEGATGFAGAIQEPLAGGVFVYELPFGFRTYCLGDGSGTPCPCGNPATPGSEAGCANSGAQGATLRAEGTTRISADDMILLAANMVPGQPALAFAGENAVSQGSGASFGDGLRCAGTSLIRLGWRSAGSGGGASWGPALAQHAGWTPGDIRFLQVFYRDPQLGPCGSGFNATNGLEVWFVEG